MSRNLRGLLAFLIIVNLLVIDIVLYLDFKKSPIAVAPLPPARETVIDLPSASAITEFMEQPFGEETEEGLAEEEGVLLGEDPDQAIAGPLPEGNFESGDPSPDPNEVYSFEEDEDDDDGIPGDQPQPDEDLTPEQPNEDVGALIAE